MKRVLVAGIGNVFCGDDAFGCAVARELLQRRLPAGISVRDFGIRGFDLACALLDGYDAAILVDAMARGRAPGSLHVLEPTLPAAESSGGVCDGHGLTPERVLKMLVALGGKPPVLRVVGCEPAELGSELEPRGELSDVVSASVPKAVALVLDLLAELGVGSLAEASCHA
jgi:hydrogenase maturation protease